MKESLIQYIQLIRNTILLSLRFYMFKVQDNNY